MLVRIENRSHSALAASVARRLAKLLGKLPAQDLVGLDVIVLVDHSTDKRSRFAAGVYWEKTAERPATIEIAVDMLYARVPRIVPFLPFVGRFILADVLYHEIGHHQHQRFAHGVSKRDREAFADQYRKRMLRRAFVWWRLVLLPFGPVIHWLHRAVNATDRRTR